MAFPVGWDKIRIVVDAAQVAGSGSHTNFPVLLTESCLGSAANTIFGVAHHSGRDIRISSDSAGATRLAVDIAEWDSVGKTCRVWVKVPSLSGTANTTLYFWYGNQTAAAEARNATYGGEAVWVKSAYDMKSEQTGMDRSAIRAHASTGTVQTAPNTVFIRDTTAYAAFPSLIRLASGRLICTFREASEHGVNIDGNVYVHSSEDDGRTWASLSSVTNASYDLRDPNLMQRANGDIWLVYTKTNSGDTARTVQYVISDDDGETWGSELTASSGRTKAISRGKPIVRTNGDICVPCYEYNGTNFKPFIAIYNGSTWTEYDVVGSFGAYNEWSVVESTTANDLIGFFREEGGDGINRGYFTDSTHTWGSLSVVYSIGGASTPAEVRRHPSVSSSLIMAVSYDRLNRSVIKRSTDEGQTWGAAQIDLTRVGLLSGMGAYESICQLSNNQWGVACHWDTTGQSTPSKIYFARFEIGATAEMTGPPDWAGTDGVVFDGTNDYFADCGVVSSFSYLQNTGIFSMTWRGKLDNPNGGLLNIFAANSPSSGEKGFFFGHEDRTAVSTDRALRFFLTQTGGLIVDSQTADATYTSTDMKTVCVTGDATAISFYIDGAAQTDDGATQWASKGSGDSTRAMAISRLPNLSVGYLDGSVEFLSFSAATVSADWAATQHANLSAPGTFAAFSAEDGCWGIRT